MDHRELEHNVIAYQNGKPMSKEANLKLLQVIEQAVQKFSKMIPRGDPDDVRGEVVFHTVKILKEYDPKYRITTWIYRIARNKIIDSARRWDSYRAADGTMRKKAEAGKRSLEMLETDDEERRSNILAITSQTPYDIVQQNMDDVATGLEYLAGVFTHTNSGYKKNMKIYEQILSAVTQSCTYEQMVQAYNLPEGTIKSNIFRARKVTRKVRKQQPDTIGLYVQEGKKILHNRLTRIVHPSKVYDFSHVDVQRQELYDAVGLDNQQASMWEHTLTSTNNMRKQENTIAILTGSTKKDVQYVHKNTSPEMEHLLKCELPKDRMHVFLS